MNRREWLALLGAGALAVHGHTIAQQPNAIRRIGILQGGTPAVNGHVQEAFVRRMSELGFAEGKNLAIETRWSEGKIERFPGFVAELLEKKVEVIFAPSGVAAQAAQRSGTKTPIVFAFPPDPVGQGFGQSLARPGGTMTGMTSTHGELSAKRVELLRETLPRARRVAVLYFLAQSAAGVPQQLAETARAAKKLGLSLVTEESPNPDDFKRAFAAIQKQRPDALIFIENPMFFANQLLLTQFAAASRLPSIYNVAEYVQAGGLMSYGASYADLAGRAATHVVKILNGAHPGDLPIEQPTRFELVINMKTAKAIGLTIPRAVMLRADRVVD